MLSYVLSLALHSANNIINFSLLVESDETLFLLATSYYRAGKPNQAYAVLRGKGASCPQCRFLLAKCCIDLQKYVITFF